MSDITDQEAEEVYEENERTQNTASSPLKKTRWIKSTLEENEGTQNTASSPLKKTRGIKSTLEERIEMLERASQKQATTNNRIDGYLKEDEKNIGALMGATKSLRARLDLVEVDIGKMNHSVVTGFKKMNIGFKTLGTKLSRTLGSKKRRSPLNLSAIKMPSGGEPETPRYDQYGDEYMFLTDDMRKSQIIQDKEILRTEMKQYIDENMSREDLIDEKQVAIDLAWAQKKGLQEKVDKKEAEKNRIQEEEEEKNRLQEGEEEKRLQEEQEEKKRLQEEEEKKRLQEEDEKKRLQEEEEEKKRLQKEEEEKKRLQEEEEEKKRLQEEEEEKKRLQQEELKLQKMALLSQTFEKGMMINGVSVSYNDVQEFMKTFAENKQ